MLLSPKSNSSGGVVGNYQTRYSAARLVYQNKYQHIPKSKFPWNFFSKSRLPLRIWSLELGEGKCPPYVLLWGQPPLLHCQQIKSPEHTAPIKGISNSPFPSLPLGGHALFLSAPSVSYREMCLRAQFNSLLVQGEGCLYYTSPINTQKKQHTVPSKEILVGIWGGLMLGVTQSTRLCYGTDCCGTPLIFNFWKMGRN